MTDDPAKVAASPSSMRLVLTLAIAGLISGIAIIGIYEWTLPTITANKARELRGELIAVEKPAKDEPVVYGGYDDQGEFVGYAIPAAGPGFQDTIGLLYGYRPGKKIVVGMEVLESRETPGLGDKIYKDPVFVGGFSALSVVPKIVAVKKGTQSQPNEIDVITGATISSKAVVRIINETHEEWSGQLPAPGSEPPLVRTEPAAAEAGQ